MADDLKEVEAAGVGGKWSLSIDIFTSLTLSIAQDFIDGYYAALNNPKKRGNIASFYVKEIPGTPVKANIILNGVSYPDSKAVQAIFEKDTRSAIYEVEDFDFHIVNSSYNVGAPVASQGPDKDGKNVSFIIVINGNVKYGGEGEARGFMDNVIMVPNWDSHSPKAAKGLNKWLVQSQNFREISWLPLT